MKIEEPTTTPAPTEEATFAPGFRSQYREQRYNDLPVEGAFPDWLEGALIRTGPALFELENDRYNHWFDGLALLHKFEFREGQINYANRFLKSTAYNEAQENGKISIKEFATDPCRNLFQKVKSFVVPPQPTDNGNISIIKNDDVWLATSETPLPVSFDEHTLQTLSHFDFEDDLDGQIQSAHPHYAEDGSVYNYLLKFGLRSKYFVFKKPAGSKSREVVAKIKAPNPSYMHSIGMSENYLILTEFPKIVHPMELAFGDKPLIENYHWKPELGTKYQVINRETGMVTCYEGDAIFGFHHVNSFEENDHLYIDFVAYDDASVLDHLYLDALRSNEPTNAAGYLTRATIDLRQKSPVTLERLSEKSLELPRINYQQKNTRHYRYAYGAGNTVPGNFLDDITKIDVQTGDATVWYTKDHYPSEPVFVQQPGTEKEDEGILLSVVVNSTNNTTFLLALDASTMEEMARATVPEVIPFGFHGQFASGS